VKRKIAGRVEAKVGERLKEGGLAGYEKKESGEKSEGEKERGEGENGVGKQ